MMSVNVRGLRDATKRRSIFNFYRKRAKILLFQESHSELSDEEIWRNEWGGEILFSHGETNSRGVCILLPREMNFTVSKVDKDEQGRLIICQINIQENNITLVNIYAPNEDDPVFFQTVIKRLENFTENKIVMGDYNLVINPELDRLQSTYNNHKAAEIVTSWMQDSHVEDIWRNRNPDVRRFSWYASRIKTASRIDFALIDQGLCDQVVSCEYSTGVHTDHSAFYLAIDMTENERGRGYWKLNVTHLKSKEFLEAMNKYVEEEKYNLRHLDPKKKWEILKFGIAAKAQEYSRYKSGEDELIVSNLSEKVVELEERIGIQPDLQVIEMFENTKADLDIKQMELARKAIFRSGAKTLGEFERNTSYFYALEKSRYNAKTVHTILREDGQIVSDAKGILAEEERYYGKLFAEDKNVSFRLENHSGVRLAETTKLEQNKPFTKEEVAKAVLQLNNNKVPGLDGLPIDIYKCMWAKLEDIFVEMMNSVYETKRLTTSMLQGIVNLLPKAGRDGRKLLNKRPITLLNSDYKVIEKVIANRMVPAMEEIISKDQKGFFTKPSYIH